jgi:flagellar hook-basal body complex protein FliE
MTPVQPISIAGSDALASITQTTTPVAAPQAAAPGFSFTDLFTNGMAQVESKVQHADEMVRRFALDDSVPVHQVTIAIEEARMAVDMALQVRSRLVEAYRELMNTQL